MSSQEFVPAAESLSSPFIAGEDPPEALGFRQFILKVAERCNYNCDYCYMYNMQDQSWRDRTTFMSLDTIRTTAERIAEHVGQFGLEEVQVILHGGEPLLRVRNDPQFIKWIADLFRKTVSGRVEFGLQTNGSLLNETVLDQLLAAEIGVGVSVDGSRSVHNEHRKYHNGQGTYEDTMRGIKLLEQPKYQTIYGGLLYVIGEVAVDPLTEYEAVTRGDRNNPDLRFDRLPPALNFLLPLGNWSQPPPGRGPNGTTPYADWLIPIYDHWRSSGDSAHIRIRLFDTIQALLLGRPNNAEDFGLAPPANVVIESDGSIELVDAWWGSLHGP